jgi:hypothetical protein
MTRPEGDSQVMAFRDAEAYYTRLLDCGATESGEEVLPRACLTYGQLPLYSEFDCHFYAYVASEDNTHPRFAFTNCKRVGTDSVTCTRLYDLIEAAIEEDSEESLEWASCVLSTLHFEWV